MIYKKIYVEITNMCNKSCYFCSKSKREKREMSLEEFSEVIKKIKGYTQYIYLHIKGEPLLHSNLDEMLSICDKNDIKVNITTNGSLLNIKKEILVNHACVRQINISVHSVSEREIDEIIESVDYINEKSNIYLVYRYWILKDIKIQEIEIINKLIQHYQLSSQKTTDIKNNKNIMIKKNLYLNKDLEFEWPTLHSDYINECGFCLGLKSHIGILSDGTIVPCCLDADGEIKLGNIFEDELKKIIESDLYQQMLKGFRENKRICNLCKHCSFNNKKS